MDKLLTQKDLAARWQVSVASIETWRKEGIITPVKGIPSIRYSPQYIAEIEGVKLERFSPLERRRMALQIEELQHENEQLKSILANILAESSKVIKLEYKFKDSK